MENIKPELTASEACHRLVLIEGQKENGGKEKGGDKVLDQIFGVALMLFALALAINFLKKRRKRK